MNMTERERRQLKNNRHSMITTLETNPSYELSNIRCRLASSPKVPIERLKRNIEQL